MGNSIFEQLHSYQSTLLDGLQQACSIWWKHFAALAGVSYYGDAREDKSLKIALKNDLRCCCLGMSHCDLAMMMGTRRWARTTGGGVLMTPLSIASCS
jgi:hypothetical protein